MESDFKKLSISDTPDETVLRVISEVSVIKSPSKRGASKKKTLTENAFHQTNAYEHHVKLSSATMSKIGIRTGDLVIIHSSSGIDGSNGDNSLENVDSGVHLPVHVWRGIQPDDSVLVDSVLFSEFSSQVEDSTDRMFSLYAKIERIVSPLLEAERIVIEFDALLRSDGMVPSIVQSKLLGSVVVENRSIVIPIYGRQIRVLVKSVETRDKKSNGHSAVVGPNTSVETSADELKSAAGTTRFQALRHANYADIGGLSAELEQIRELIELPLTRPELFTEYGVPPPRGVLLYGPPGTGKTLLARAVASECGAHVFVISGGTFQSSGQGTVVGALEARLRDVFDQARQAIPSLVVIDEIDSIAPIRDDTVSESERRAVATLLSILDGAVPMDGVVVLATTNRPDSVDPALRRPGRLDAEIEIGVPTAAARKEILLCLLSKITNTISSDSIDSVARKCHGFVGADLEAVIHETSLAAVKRIHEVQSDADFSLNSADLEVGCTRVRPSAMREIILDIPRVLWSEIGGHSEIKDKLKEAVEWPLKYGDAFARMGVRAPRGILLYGPPGCSKTMMAKALATESGLNFVAIKGPELFSKWVGESERAVKRVFSRARAVAPSVVFLDEVDALGSIRGGTGGTGSVQDRVLSQLLSEMDGVVSLKDVVVVAATNRPDMLDPALMRPGRFDRILYVGLPDLTARREIFQIGLRNVKLDIIHEFGGTAGDNGVQIVGDWLANKCDGYSGAECAAVCREGVMQALFNAPLPDTIMVEGGAVKKEHFDAALKRVRPRTTPATLKFYSKFHGQHSGAEL